jgi:hypothetical protein
MLVPDVRLDTSLFRFVPVRPPRTWTPAGFRPPHPIPDLFSRPIIVTSTRSVTTAPPCRTEPLGLLGGDRSLTVAAPKARTS